MSLTLVLSQFSIPCLATDQQYRGPALLASIDSQLFKKRAPISANYLEPEDQFYREYVSANDAGLVLQHNDQFGYTQQQKSFAATSWRDELVSPGTLDTQGHAPNESDVRAGLARTIFKARIRLMIHIYFANQKRPKILRKAYTKTADTIEQAKNFRMNSESFDEHRRPTEIRGGYDVMTDAGKVEMTSHLGDAGFYHPSLTGALSGSSPLLEAVSVSVSPVAPSDRLPRPNISYTLFGDSISTGLTQQFGDLSTNLVRTTPLKGEAPSRYDIRFSLTF